MTSHPASKDLITTSSILSDKAFIEISSVIINPLNLNLSLIIELKSFEYVTTLLSIRGKIMCANISKLSFFKKLNGIKSVFKRELKSTLILEQCVCVSFFERPCPGKCFKTGKMPESLKPLQNSLISSKTVSGFELNALSPIIE